ncbi:hypothetical protein JS756_23420 [Streptomyces actuosus]|uniref:Uncharacterized protein n=1 Tax=Streptomyces actuosus TaxID=1885 RepID=A0ABS2VVN4_STRAS|nr:hypothetical protein [Streptomyces actuosus]MBN0047010.1 hypothetical protein [Streptomyces actuosus]
MRTVTTDSQSNLRTTTAPVDGARRHAFAGRATAPVTSYGDYVDAVPAQ